MRTLGSPETSESVKKAGVMVELVHREAEQRCTDNITRGNTGLGPKPLGHFGDPINLRAYSGFERKGLDCSNRRLMVGRFKHCLSR